MQAEYAFSAGMPSRQYTVRNIPPEVDRALRRKARESGKSLNTVILDELAKATDQTRAGNTYDDLDELIGTWREDKGFDRAVEAFAAVDEGLWK
jgi:hypothetical protein